MQVAGSATLATILPSTLEGRGTSGEETKALFAHTRPLFVHSYELVVRDLERVSRYYQKAIGLELISSHLSGHVLGVGGVPLLTLEQDKTADVEPRRTAGLYHMAFLVPTREDLGRFLKHLVEEKISLDGSADHLVSEALYLSDPEGNGIEVYADRSHQVWEFDRGGHVRLDSKALDVRGLLAAAAKGPWEGLPARTGLGHIHLQVGDVPEAAQFYEGVMGMKVMARMKGAIFFATGDYHHHIGANVWHSEGALKRKRKMSGLKGYRMVYNDAAEMEKAIQTLDELEIVVTSSASGKVIEDPWGMRIELGVV
ncbi:MAG: VOC family protein [Verrucomicrobiota bacterium]